MSFKGIVIVKDKVLHTEFKYPKRFIEGKNLLLIKQNKDGSCECMWGALNTVTIDVGDIAKLIWNQFVPLEEIIKSSYTVDELDSFNSYLSTLSQGTYYEQLRLGNRNDGSTLLSKGDRGED